MKSIIILLLVVLIWSVTSNSQKSRAAIVTKDTVYVPALKVPSGIWIEAMDSVMKVLVPAIGKSMTVDQADFYKDFFYRQMNKIINQSLPDSIGVAVKKQDIKPIK